MARRVSDYRIRRIADRGNEKVDRDPGNISEIKGLRRESGILKYNTRSDRSGKGSESSKRIEGEKGLVEGDGPTVVTGGPVASMATLSFVPKVQVDLLVEARFTNLNLEVDCGPQDQMGRKDYEGPTTTSLDVLNSLSSKIATTKCVGAELFERFKLIAKSDRSNAPYDLGGTGLIPGETTHEVKLFRRVMVTLINGSRVDVPFDPGNRRIATTPKGNVAVGPSRVVKCYNYQGEGYMTRQRTQPKRPRNAAWFKEKLMLAEAAQILDEEQHAFLANPGILEATVAQQTIPQNLAF
nr:hypothetical protein [Tanacetum cinerariifolium]